MLKNILPNEQDPSGKLAPNWQGPYMVKTTFSGEALILTEMDGNDLPNPTNDDAVKMYYY